MRKYLYVMNKEGRFSQHFYCVRRIFIKII